jgi:peroxiredoxin
MRLSKSFLFSACLLTLLLSEQPGKTEEMVSDVKVGQEAPLFTVHTIEGIQIDTAALKGKIVLLNFWATWCAPCRIEMPRLENEIWSKFKGSQFVMVAIAREETDEQLVAFRKKSSYSFPMASDPKREVYSKFANAGVPRSYVIGVDGKVVYHSVGYSESDFEQLLQAINREMRKTRLH